LSVLNAKIQKWPGKIIVSLTIILITMDIISGTGSGINNNGNINSNITLEKIAPEQIELLTKYRLEYLAEMQGELSPEYKAELEKGLNEYFREVMQGERFFAYMALQGEKIVSFGAMVIKKIPGDANKPVYTEGDILNMYTVPEERRKGYSAVILQRLIDEARHRGISKISLHTSKDGEKLYRKFGFNEPHYPVLELPL
jgi:GNAT superfamily N-acetyltransferase